MLDFRKGSINNALRKVLKRFHYCLEVMLARVRWYVAYPLSLRHIEEMMQERGVFVDHAAAHRWTIKMLPVLAAVFRRRKKPVGTSWRMDETYIKVAAASGNIFVGLLTAEVFQPALLITRLTAQLLSARLHYCDRTVKLEWPVNTPSQQDIPHGRRTHQPDRHPTLLPERAHRGFAEVSLTSMPNPSA